MAASHPVAPSRLRSPGRSPADGSTARVRLPQVGQRRTGIWDSAIRTASASSSTLIPPGWPRLPFPRGLGGSHERGPGVIGQAHAEPRLQLADGLLQGEDQRLGDIRGHGPNLRRSGEVGTF